MSNYNRNKILLGFFLGLINYPLLWPLETYVPAKSKLNEAALNEIKLGGA